MMPRLLIVASMALLLLLPSTGCKQDPIVFQPDSFNRPEALAFACLNMVPDPDDLTLPPELQALSACDESAGTIDTTTNVLIAFLTQTATGEVAAIDLRGEGSVFDASDAVPGFTFIRVGEVPMGLVVPAETPGATFVANFASRSVQVFPTTWTVAGEIVNPGVDPTPTNVNLSGGPTDLAIDPTGHFLFAPLPDAGMIVQLEIDDDGNFIEDGMGNPRVIEIPLDLPMVAPIDPTSNTDYSFTCPVDYPLRAADTTASVPVTLGTTPRPVKIHVLDDRILIADSAQPVIHSYDLGAYGIFADSMAAAPLNPQQVATSVPTLDVVATPEVSAMPVDGSPVLNRYLYAIDATDLSVMAIDYTNPAAAFVIATNVGPQLEDRIRLGGFGGAQALEVLTPDFVDQNYCPGDGDSSANLVPTYLRGVFLSVAMTDGTVRFVDVEDLNATCRGTDSLCNPDTAEGNDDQVFIQRHRARVGSYIVDSLQLTGTPSLSFNTSPGRLGNDGVPTSGSGPRLLPLEFDATANCPMVPADAYFPITTSTGQAEVSYDCRAYMKPLFGDEESPLVCTQSDPWAFQAQTWLGTWNGYIPGSNGGRARLEPPSANVMTDPYASFCETGILGADDVTDSALGADDPEEGYQGDQLIILSEPPERMVVANPICEKFLIPESGSEEREPIAFRVLAATPTSLTLDTSASVGGYYDHAEVVTCYPDPFSYQVSTLETYAVVGSQTGFRHRVIDNGGRCLVDTTQAVDICDTQTYRNSRAFIGRPFISPEISFDICFDPGESGNCDTVLPDDATSQLYIEVGDAPSQVFLDVGSQPVTLRYNEQNGRLYSVDADRLGLVSMDLYPLSTVQEIK